MWHLQEWLDPGPSTRQARAPALHYTSGPQGPVLMSSPCATSGWQCLLPHVLLVWPGPWPVYKVESVSSEQCVRMALGAGLCWANRSQLPFKQLSWEVVFGSELLAEVGIIGTMTTAYWHWCILTATDALSIPSLGSLHTPPFHLKRSAYTWSIAHGKCLRRSWQI